MSLIRWEEGKHPRGRDGRFITPGSAVSIDGGKGGHGRVVKIDKSEKKVHVQTPDGVKKLDPVRLNRAVAASKPTPTGKSGRSAGGKTSIQLEPKSVHSVDASVSRDQYMAITKAYLDKQSPKKGEHVGVAQSKTKLAFYKAGAALAIAASLSGGSTGEAGGQGSLLHEFEGQVGHEVEQRLPPDVEKLRSFASKLGSDESDDPFHMVIPARSLTLP